MSIEVNIVKEIQTKISGSLTEVKAKPETVINNRELSVSGNKTNPVSQRTLIEEKTKHTEDESVKQAVQDINQHMQDYRREIQFSVDEDTGRTVIKVFDQETNNLIRQIPAEEVLEIARKLMEDKEGKGKLLEVSV